MDIIKASTMPHQVLCAVIALRNFGRVESVGLDKVGSSLQVLQMDVQDNIGARKNKHVVVSLQWFGVILEFLPYTIK